MRRYFGHLYRKQDAGAAQQRAQPPSVPCSPKKIRRLRRAFLYHFILQFRFWLQGEAKKTRPARRRRLARNASLALLFCKTVSRCSKGRNCRRLKRYRRLRRAFLYHFVLQVRFWLQREANTQKQSRSSSAISAQTFAVNLKNFALAALFWPFLQEPRRGRNAAARSAPQPPL